MISNMDILEVIDYFGITEDMIHDYIEELYCTTLNEEAKDSDDRSEYTVEDRQYDRYVKLCHRHQIKPLSRNEWRHETKKKLKQTLAVAVAAGTALGANHYYNHTERGHNARVDRQNKIGQRKAETARGNYRERQARKRAHRKARLASIGWGGRPEY